jgi:hypothetical protein
MPKATTLPSRAPGPSPDFSSANHAPPLNASTNKPPRDGQRIDFDPALVAKKGDHWEEIFESLLMRWLDEASTEARDQLRRSVARV